MKRLLLPAFLLILLLPVFFGGGFFCAAQDIKMVSGRVTNKTDGAPVTDVMIYAFNTFGDAQDAYDNLISGNIGFDINNVIEVFPDQSGYYETRVATTGAIVFYCPMLEKDKACQIIRVDGQQEINVQFTLEQILPPVILTGDTRVEIAIVEPPKEDGEYIISLRAFPFKPDDRLIRSDSRLVVQSSVIDCDTGDTVSFGSPLVRDGVKYHSTQFRRMNFDPNGDPLFPYADRDKPLSDSLNIIQWADTIYRENPNHFYQCVNNLWLEDYNHVYFTFSDTYDTKRLRRPMQFLEYTLEPYNLDPEKFRKRPHKEVRPGNGNLSLTFLPNQAKIDPSDTVSLNSLEQLKKEIKGDEYTSLKEFHIMGVASPEGPYAKNLQLANQRMSYAFGQITSILSAHERDRVYHTEKGRVATWDEVADLLYADSLKVEAEEIRKIARTYPKNMDQQWAKIRSLPYYRTEISPRLPKLRSVGYKYVTLINRELTPVEILERYNTDADYRNGTKEFALYEFWNLFNMVKDEKELAALYRRAITASEKVEAKKWVLPANNLAVLCIKNETPDTTILAPFIDFTRKCNSPLRSMDGKTTELINPEQVIANQVVMMLMIKKYFRAAQLAVMLPKKKEYIKLSAITKCLAGYVKRPDTPENKKVFEYVRDSTTLRNKVVMNIASGNLGLAKMAISHLPEDDPTTMYLAVQISCLECQKDNQNYMSLDFEKADLLLNQLVECFKKDKKFIRIAEADWDVFEDLVADAKREYEAQMNNPDAENNI